MSIPDYLLSGSAAFFYFLIHFEYNSRIFQYKPVEQEKFKNILKNKEKTKNSFVLIKDLISLTTIRFCSLFPLLTVIFFLLHGHAANIAANC